jgi:hypothetical protein
MYERPVGKIESTAGKWFAAGFALYAGLLFLGSGAILFYAGSASHAAPASPRGASSRDA